jgi:hypothetical protein
MERVNGYPVYHLGSMLGILTATVTKPGVLYGDLAGPAANAEGALENFANDPLLSIPKSKAAAHQLAEGLKWLRSEEKQQILHEPIKPEEIAALMQAMFYFQTVLLADLSDLDLYFISSKGAFDTKKLIFTAEHAVPLPAESLAEISPHVLDDVKEAGRCLVFDLPTAAGFHMFRAIEAVVLAYFPLLKITLRDSDRNLGRYLRLLEGAGVEPKIIGMLTHIKDFYRNPLVHPELFLGPAEALGIFAIGPSAIAAMAADLDEIRGGKQLRPREPPRREELPGYPG